MENHHQTSKKSDNFHKIKSGSSSTKHILNGENNEHIINMESTNNRNTQQAPQVSLSSSKGVITNSNSPKMGSRRIFTPQFKLQVLESYRSDNDCKGNQRATARKYNIHRRQIQKWLQCESSLRSSVANINLTSVKHQFHNVSVQQQQTKHVEITTHSSVSSSSYASSQLHSTHLCLDSTRSSVSLKSIKVPSLSSCVTAPSIQGSHDIFEASKLAAVVATAAGTIAITSSSATSSASTPVVSPLRPSVTVISNRNTNSAITPLLHHSHHYGIPPYSNMSSTANVPILAHHLSNTQQHIHQETHLPHQTSYQYNNMTYSPTISQPQTETQPSTSYFTPISLPTVNALSAAASTASSYAGRDTELSNKLDLIPMESKAYSNFVLLSDKPAFLCNNNNNKGYANYECPKSAGVTNSSNINFVCTINQLKENASSYSTAYPFGPMDLSLRHRRDVKSEFVENIKSNFYNTEIPVRKEWNDKLDVVDLTYRKRRLPYVPHSSEDYKNEFPEKHLKLSKPDIVLNKSLTYNQIEDCANHITTNLSNSNDDDDVEIEVGMEEKFPTSSKPVKLFKPYLLDECENKDSYARSSLNKFTKTEHSKQLEQITTSSFSNDILTTISSNDGHTRDNTFPDFVKENIIASADGSNFLVESRCESPRSACSPATSVPTMSPTNFQCPKGSPASSGYESSTSTYSDSSSSSRNDTFTYGQTYCVNLQMQTIYNENIHIIHPSKNVQRWLEKDDSKPLASNSSIALLV